MRETIPRLLSLSLLLSTLACGWSDSGPSLDPYELPTNNPPVTEEPLDTTDIPPDDDDNDNSGDDALLPLPEPLSPEDACQQDPREDRCEADVETYEGWGTFLTPTLIELSHSDCCADINNDGQINNAYANLIETLEGVTGRDFDVYQEVIASDLATHDTQLVYELRQDRESSGLFFLTSHTATRSETASTLDPFPTGAYRTSNTASFAIDTDGSVEISGGQINIRIRALDLPVVVPLNIIDASGHITDQGNGVQQLNLRVDGYMRLFDVFANTNRSIEQHCPCVDGSSQALTWTGPYFEDATCTVAASDLSACGGEDDLYTCDDSLEYCDTFAQAGDLLTDLSTTQLASSCFEDDRLFCDAFSISLEITAEVTTLSGIE
jgi:hypothetical protein